MVDHDGVVGSTITKQLEAGGETVLKVARADLDLRDQTSVTNWLTRNNEWYAVAKIAGIKPCQVHRKQYGRHYVSVMPSNLHGERDDFALCRGASCRL